MGSKNAWLMLSASGLGLKRGITLSGFQGLNSGCSPTTHRRCLGGKTCPPTPWVRNLRGHPRCQLFQQAFAGEIAVHTMPALAPDEDGREGVNVDCRDLVERVEDQAVSPHDDSHKQGSRGEGEAHSEQQIAAICHMQEKTRLQPQPCHTATVLVSQAAQVPVGKDQDVKQAQAVRPIAEVIKEVVKLYALVVPPPQPAQHRHNREEPDRTSQEHT
eukprot:scaffold1650_cov351-Prasinococcus_capsulatus_cf.AAC.22